MSIHHCSGFDCDGIQGFVGIIRGFAVSILGFAGTIRGFVVLILGFTGTIRGFGHLIQGFTFYAQFDVLEMVLFAVADDMYSVG